MSDPSYREMISAGVMEAQLEATSGASGWATGTTPTDNLYRAGGENSLKAAFQCDCIEKWEFITVNVETPLLMNIASLGLVGRGLNDARRGQQSAQETFGGWSGATPGAETRRWLQAMKVGQVKICPGRSCPITQKLTKEQKDAVSSTYVGFEPKQYFSWFWGVDQCLLIKSEIRQVGGESFTTQVDSPVGKVTITYTLTRRTYLCFYKLPWPEPGPGDPQPPQQGGPTTPPDAKPPSAPPPAPGGGTPPGPTTKPGAPRTMTIGFLSDHSILSGPPAARGDSRGINQRRSYIERHLLFNAP